MCGRRLRCPGRYWVRYILSARAKSVGLMALTSHGWQDMAYRLFHSQHNVRVQLRREAEIMRGVSKGIVTKVRFEQGQRCRHVLPLAHPPAQAMHTVGVAKIQTFGFLELSQP